MGNFFILQEIETGAKSRFSNNIKCKFVKKIRDVYIFVPVATAAQILCQVVEYSCQQRKKWLHLLRMEEWQQYVSHSCPLWIPDQKNPLHGFKVCERKFKTSNPQNQTIIWARCRWVCEKDFKPHSSSMIWAIQPCPHCWLYRGQMQLLKAW